MFFTAPPVIPTRVFARLPDALRRAGSRHRVASRATRTRIRSTRCSRVRPSTATVRCGASTFRTAASSASRRTGNSRLPPNTTASRTGSPSIATAASSSPTTPTASWCWTRQTGKVSAVRRARAAGAPQGGQRPRLREQRRPLLHRPGPDRPARPDGSGLPRAGRRAASTACSTTFRVRTASRSIPTETSLYVAVTRANAVWRVPLMPDGSVAKVGNFIQLSGGGGPDGLAVDRDGNLAVAHIGLGCRVAVQQARRADGADPVLSAGYHTTNMAFGGADGTHAVHHGIGNRDTAARRNARARTPALFPPGALAARAMPRPGRF